MKITNYIDAVRYLEGFIGKIIFKVDPQYLKHHDPLERMRVLLSLLGNPQEKFKSVLVGGTSGKGSIAYLISYILTTAGYKTGFTLSPHLEKINERLQINNKPITDERFVKLLKSIILPSIRQMSKMRIGAPSYFEILIGMAFLYFAQSKVDIAVVEVGMGGEFDATNTLDPLIAVLTNVGLDHTNVLGKSVEKIARTKAGIIKKNKESRIMNQEGNHNSRFMIHDSIVVSGVKQPSVIKIIEKKCEDTGSRLTLLWRDFSFKIKKESSEGSVFDLTISRDRVHSLNDLWLSLIGKYQVENASLAIETVLQLGKFGFKVKEKDIREALKTAFFAGRFEVLSVISPQLSVVGDKSVGSRLISFKTDGQRTGRPESENRKPKTDNRIILDGAHNSTKMKAFLSTLKKLYPEKRKIFIVGFKFDKDIKKMLKQIVKIADEIIITEFKAKTDTNIHASANAESIKYQVLSIKYGGKISVEKDSKKALALALNYPVTQLSNYRSIIVVTGSLYLVGEIRIML